MTSGEKLPQVAILGGYCHSITGYLVCQVVYTRKMHFSSTGSSLLFVDHLLKGIEFFFLNLKMQSCSDNNLIIHYILFNHAQCLAGYPMALIPLSIPCVVLYVHRGDISAPEFVQRTSRVQDTILV